MGKTYTSSIPKGASLKAAGQFVGEEYLISGEAIGLVQKFVTILSPAQVGNLSSDSPMINLPTRPFIFVAGGIFYEEGFDSIDIAGADWAITTADGAVLTKQNMANFPSGDWLQLQSYTERSQDLTQSAHYTLSSTEEATNTNLGRLKVVLYVLPIDSSF
jgi:hypothetical protein